MAVNIFPQGSGGGSPIKSIQRGVASSSGDITISAVNTAKTMVRSFSTGSSGTVAATGAIGSQSISANVDAHNMTISPRGVQTTPPGGGPANRVTAGWAGGSHVSVTTPAYGFAHLISPVTYPSSNVAQDIVLPAPAATWPIAAASVPGNIGPTNITGGTTSLTSAEFGVYLVDSTTITATGACRWEVIEFN